MKTMTVLTDRSVGSFKNDPSDPRTQFEPDNDHLYIRGVVRATKPLVFGTVRSRKSKLFETLPLENA